MTALSEHIRDTDSEFAVNKKPATLIHPIPFFGDLLRAKVITIGLNPSATEFEERGWPQHLDSDALTKRLLGYFKREPHPWFDKWEEVLQLMGASYTSNAAHLDISARATVSAGSVSDLPNFEKMLSADLPWMIRFLNLACEVRLVLLAGTATKALYINEFLYKKLDPAQASLEGSLARAAGNGKVAHHTLVIGSRRLPVYFCSSSPSDRRNPGILRMRIERDAQLLQRHVNRL